MGNSNYNDFSDVDIRSLEQPPPPPSRMTSRPLPENAEELEKEKKKAEEKEKKQYKDLVTGVVCLKLLVLFAVATGTLVFWRKMGTNCLWIAVILPIYVVVLPLALAAIGLKKYFLILPYLLVQIISCLLLPIFVGLPMLYDIDKFGEFVVMLVFLLFAYAVWLFYTYCVIRVVMDERHTLDPRKKREPLPSAHRMVTIRSFADKECQGPTYHQTSI